MDEKEFKALMDKFKAEAQPFVETAITDATKGLITQDQLKEELSPLTSEDGDIKKLQKASEEQGLELRKYIEGQRKEEPMTVRKALTQKSEELKRLYNKEINSLMMKVDKATVQSSDVGSDSAGIYVPGAGRSPNRLPFLKDLFNQATMGDNSHNVVYYTDQTTDSAAASVFEEAAEVPSSSNIAWTQYSLDIENVGDSIKVAQRSIENIDFIASEVDFFLRKNINLKSDSYLYSGTGSNQPYGVTTRATAYTAGSYATSYADANLMDLIRVCRALAGTNTPFVADTVILNILDAEKYLYGKKDANNNYIIPQNGGLIPLIHGINVIVNNGVTANTMVVGDFSYGTIYQQKGLNVEFGYVDDDFQKNLITMKAYEEFNLLIRSVHQKAFQYVSDISTAIAGLEEEVA